MCQKGQYLAQNDKKCIFWPILDVSSGVLEFVSFQMCQGACIVALITMKRFFSWMGTDVIFGITSCCAGEATMRAAVKLFSWMNQHVCLEMRRSCEGVITLFGTERFFSGMNHREGRGCWGRVITTCARTIMKQNMFFFSSNCQVYRLCSCICCKWRTSFCHSKAPWDGWQSCLFPHSCFFKPGIF